MRSNEVHVAQSYGAKQDIIYICMQIVSKIYLKSVRLVILLTLLLWNYDILTVTHIIKRHVISQ